MGWGIIPDTHFKRTRKARLTMAQCNAAPTNGTSMDPTRLVRGRTIHGLGQACKLDTKLFRVVAPDARVTMPRRALVASLPSSVLIPARQVRLAREMPRPSQVPGACGDVKRVWGGSGALGKRRGQPASEMGWSGECIRTVERIVSRGPKSHGPRGPKSQAKRTESKSHHTQESSVSAKAGKTGRGPKRNRPRVRGSSEIVEETGAGRCLPSPCRPRGATTTTYVHGSISSMQTVRHGGGVRRGTRRIPGAWGSTLGSIRRTECRNGSPLR